MPLDGHPIFCELDATVLIWSAMDVCVLCQKGMECKLDTVLSTMQDVLESLLFEQARSALETVHDEADNDSSTFLPEVEKVLQV